MNKCRPILVHINKNIYAKLDSEQRHSKKKLNKGKSISRQSSSDNIESEFF